MADKDFPTKHKAHVSIATGRQRPGPSAHPGERRVDAPVVKAAGSLVWDVSLFTIFFPLDLRS